MASCMCVCVCVCVCVCARECVRPCVGMSIEKDGVLTVSVSVSLHVFRFAGDKIKID